MAVGFGNCDNFQDTIESTVNDAIDWARLEIELSATRESNTHCGDCEKEIPIQRRLAVKGVLYCTSCQNDHDTKHQSYYNRRGSKDSQLR